MTSEKCNRGYGWGFGGGRLLTANFANDTNGTNFFKEKFAQFVEFVSFVVGRLYLPRAMLLDEKV
jgi:hypothetical protein